MRRISLLAALLAACGGSAEPSPPGSITSALVTRAAPLQSGAEPRSLAPSTPPWDPDFAGPFGGRVGPRGGRVDLLRFGVTGDARPAGCDDTAGYPAAVVSAIADSLRDEQVQFALDLGDHMYVCSGARAVADAQMQLFTDATRRFGGTWFMTLGNHECQAGTCLPGSTDANFGAYMRALGRVSQLPYYSVDLRTELGLVVLVVVADNAWDANQQAWLEQTLSRADREARYTIVARHHPQADGWPASQAIMAVVRAHKFALFLSGHAHHYTHESADQGRDMILGTGGAPLDRAGAVFGYAIVEQREDGLLQVTVYDLATGAARDRWTVGPN